MNLEWRDIPSLSALRAFDAASRTGSFSDAAKKLNVTPAAVGQQVRALEAELGVALVTRSGRGIALTPAGERLAARLASGFSTIASGIEDVRAAQTNRPVRVSTSPNFVDGSLLPRLGGFWARHPDIEISFTPTSRAVDLAREDFDVAIRVGSGDWPDLRSDRLLTTRIVICGAPSLVGSGPPDFAALPWSWDCNVPAQEATMRSIGIDPEAVARVEYGNELFEIAAARRGMAMIMATEIIVRDDIAAGALRSFEIPNAPEFGYWAVTLPGPRRKPVQAFIDWLKDSYAEG